MFARLISASVGTVVHYGFRCNRDARFIFLVICLVSGIAGTVLPFTEWFNRPSSRVRISPCSTLYA